MRTPLVRLLSSAAVLALPALAGCAVITQSPGPAAQSRIDYGPEAFARIRDSLMGREDVAEAGSRAPRVRIIAPTMLSADRMVDPTIRVSEDAYVMVVAVDLDGRPRVVFPESPEDAGFVTAQAPHKLGKFFAGFGNTGLSRYGQSVFSTQPVSRYSSSGSMFAIASSRPLQFARLATPDGDWDERKIERLTWFRETRASAYALGRELALTGQDFDTDLSGFTQSAGTPLFALAGNGYRSGLCYSEAEDAMLANVPQITRFFTRDGVTYAVYSVGDACRGYRTYAVPVSPYQPVPRDMPAPRDSLDSLRVADPRYPNGTRVEAGAGRFTTAQLDGMGPSARGGAAMNGETAALRPAEGTPTDRVLRFRPPERVRAEPRLRDQNDDMGRLNDGERERLRREAAERRALRPAPDRGEPAQPAAQPTPAREEPRPQPPHREPRPEPVRPAPPVRAEPMPMPAPAAAPSMPASSKPVKE
jgi:hypothetical protein